MIVNNAEPKLTSAIVCSPAIRERHCRSKPIATPSTAASPTRTSNSNPGWFMSMSSIFTPGRSPLSMLRVIASASRQPHTVYTSAGHVGTKRDTSIKRQKDNRKEKPNNARVGEVPAAPLVSSKLKTRDYERELATLQGRLVAMQDWVVATGARVIVVFEGRDTAGKGGTIKRILERVSPRVFRLVALPAPTERERSQMYVQRYMAHFPAAGEVVIFDRSWYNRAGVEP